MTEMTVGQNDGSAKLTRCFLGVSEYTYIKMLSPMYVYEALHHCINRDVFLIKCQPSPSLFDLP